VTGDYLHPIRHPARRRSNPRPVRYSARWNDSNKAERRQSPIRCSAPNMCCSTGGSPVRRGSTGVPPMTDHGRGGHATRSWARGPCSPLHGQDGRATGYGQDAHMLLGVTAKMAVRRAAAPFHPVWVGQRPITNSSKRRRDRSGVGSRDCSPERHVCLRPLRTARRGDPRHWGKGGVASACSRRARESGA